MLMGYNMENHRIRPLYWSSKTAHPPRSPLFFIPVNLVSEDTMNQGFCSGVFLCFLYFSSLFPLCSLSFLLLSAVIILVSFPSPYRLLFIPNPFNHFLICWSPFLWIYMQFSCNVICFYSFSLLFSPFVSLTSLLFFDTCPFKHTIHIQHTLIRWFETFNSFSYFFPSQTPDVFMLSFPPRFL